MTVTTPTPIYRIESFLDAVVNGSENTLEPISPLEMYLAKLAERDVDIPPEPVTRLERYLAKLCGQEVDIPTPKFREEFYLAKVCEEDVQLQPPIFRVEMWLAKWAGFEYPDPDEGD